MEHITDSGETRLRPARRWLTHFTQYFVVGVIAAFCDLTVFTIAAKHFGINYLVSTSASFVVGTVVSFWLCLRFVFRLNGHTWVVGLWRKVLAGLAALALNLGVMYLLVDALNMGEMRSEEFFLLDGLILARGIAIGAGFFLNFTLTKYYAFKDY